MRASDNYKLTNYMKLYHNSYLSAYGVYPRPQTTAITATGGDKPRHYFISRLNVVSYETLR
jgi:hypothetical protein